MSLPTVGEFNLQKCDGVQVPNVIPAQYFSPRFGEVHMGTGLRESPSGPRLPLQGSHADSRPHALTDCLTAGVAELAGDQDVATLLDWMSPLYRFCVSETEVDEREAMLEGVVAMVGRGELDARGLLPIIRHEPHPALAARLVTHFLQASDRSGDDNFACVREITQLVAGGHGR